MCQPSSLMICKYQSDSQVPQRLMRSLTITNDHNKKPQVDKTSKKRVQFSNLEIREYTVGLGDNPACTNGPALTLGWRFEQSSSISIVQYEESRPPRRNKNEIRIPCRIREDRLLEECGCSMKDIVSATMENKRIQKQRRKSMNNSLIFLPMGNILVLPVKNVTEKVGRKFSSISSSNINNCIRRRTVS
mmetsp:Transcript_1938/g.2956  ORF Transcript_1938/g.2956 Transcript_1938/m.2956 type:complete len:189 (+) Transcript_1938:98-664(+)